MNYSKEFRHILELNEAEYTAVKIAIDTYLDTTDENAQTGNIIKELNIVLIGME